MKATLEQGVVVLVVDDEEDLLYLVQQKLQHEGFKTEVSPNGNHLKEIIEHFPPNIILMDIHMQGVDGGLLCKALKADPKTSTIPIVMFSANDNIDKIAADCGADGFIRKPFNSKDFMNTFLHILYKTDPSLNR
jgi:CheY-like chemotaxis protein